MKKPIVFALAAALLVAATLASCGEKGPTYNTDHPEHGKITLTTDWSQRGEGIDIPGSHHVRANGDEAGKQTFTAATNDLPENMEPLLLRSL